ncbi:MAG: N-acetyltransferase [Chloroflexia bacterium]|nr:N-acetyltransferase [Chloroflexia bacterium]
MNQWIPIQQFSGTQIRLDALDPIGHRDGLIAAGADARIWDYILFAPADTPAGMDAHINEIVRRRDAELEVPYVVVRQRDDTIVGLTRFLDLRPSHRSLELGTWLNPQVHGDGTNVEVKLLMLTYAFETLNCIRVQIKTNANNKGAQRSLEALGATYEGCLRNHIITPNGSIRDSFFYSILDRDWAEVKIRLQQRHHKHHHEGGVT